jgi:hypothetical protein
MKHRRKPVPEELLEPLDNKALSSEDKGFLICDLCGESGEGTITLQNENGFVICAECVDGLAGIVSQIRSDMGVGGDLYEHRRLN